MKILDDYMNLQKQIFEYFGYKEDWVQLPIKDARKYYWKIIEDEEGIQDVIYTAKEDGLDSEDFYIDDVYKQRFLQQWIYRGDDFTMISCNPHEDGNKFLRIFDNTKEIKHETKNDHFKSPNRYINLN